MVTTLLPPPLHPSMKDPFENHLMMERPSFEIPLNGVGSSGTDSDLDKILATPTDGSARENPHHP